MSGSRASIVMPKTTPPLSNELEVSLFGPGRGECVVLHLSNGNWMIVDSCLNAEGSRAVALEYLETLKVDVGTQVKIVVVTHWHDDHIKGISGIMKEARGAEFVCSAALNCREFMSLIVADENIKLVEHTSGISEFAKTFRVINERSGVIYTKGPDHWACSEKLLYSATTPYNTKVIALSPSAQTITDSKGDLAKLIPKSSNIIRRFPRTTPNDYSVVMLVKIADWNVLLGADLERGPDVARGWRAIVTSDLRPDGKSVAYKVPHHGSGNADLDSIWSELLVENPYALLTPYAGGRKSLPSAEDVKRIKKQTDNLYCTVWPPSIHPPRRDKSVERTMDEVAKTRRAIRKCPGHIRLRIPIGGKPSDINIDLFDGATRL